MFPVGVTMRARSIERVEFAVPGVNPQLKKETSRLNKLVTLVEENEPLMQILQRCRDAKNWEPLDQHIQKTDTQDIEDEVAHQRAVKVKNWLTGGGKFSPTPAEK